jgi:hypothetical protein
MNLKEIVPGTNKPHLMQLYKNTIICPISIVLTMEAFIHSNDKL